MNQSDAIVQVTAQQVQDSMVPVGPNQEAIAMQVSKKSSQLKILLKPNGPMDVCHQKKVDICNVRDISLLTPSHEVSNVATLVTFVMSTSNQDIYQIQSPNMDLEAPLKILMPMNGNLTCLTS